MAVVGYKAHAKAPEGRPWDGAAARKRLLSWAGGPDKEKVNWGKYANGFAWYDSENKENLGAYKLPHSDIMNGAIHDVWSGVRAAMGALLGARGGTDIPGGERKGVYNHLSRHYRQFDKDPPEFRSYSEAELAMLFPEMYHAGGEDWAQVTEVRADLMPAMSPMEADAALQIVNERFAHRKLTAEEVYFLPPAELSNQNLDSYFTRMAESTLRNYAADALDGVPLMNSHRTRLTNAELPLGQSYDAMLEESGKTMRFVTLYYMLRGLRINGQETDHLIRGIEGGVIRDLSVGFRGGWYKCGLCGKELLPPMAMLFGIGHDAEEFCEHVPGVEYDGKTAWAWVEDARLVEGSLVYAGATPGAVLRKARWAAERGLLAAGDAAVLEDRWQVRILPESRLWRVEHTLGQIRVAEPKGKEVGEEVTKEEVRELVEEVAPELADRVAEAEDPVRAILQAWTEAREIRQDQDERTKKKIADLEKLAADGKEYRKTLVEQAVEARVRAQSDAFDADAYREVLGMLRLEYIRMEIEAWGKTTEEVFEPGRPVENLVKREGDGKKKPKQLGKPAAAYKA